MENRQQEVLLKEFHLSQLLRLLLHFPLICQVVLISPLFHRLSLLLENVCETKELCLRLASLCREAAVARSRICSRSPRTRST